MEPLQRRSFDGITPRRPIMTTPPNRPVRPMHAAGPGPAQPQPASPIRPQQPAVQSSSAFRPLTAQAGINPRPYPAPQPTAAQPAVRPVAAPPQSQARPTVSPSAFGAGVMQPRPATTTAAPSTHQQPLTAPSSPFRSVQHDHPAATQQPAPPLGASTHQHDPVREDTPTPKQHKGPHPTGHAGLIGFLVFIAVAALCFAPLLPGKIWHDAPGSSQSFSSGDQNLDCITTLGPITTTTTYDHKLGFPLVYSYATTSHLSATCQGQTQRADGGHTAQFNPIAIGIDFAIALAAGIITAKIWRHLRGTE